MLFSFVSYEDLDVYVPTVFEDYRCTPQIDGRNVELGVWDTAGQEGYERLRPLSYPQTDVFLLCFKADKPKTLEHIRTKWYPETSHHCPEVKRILVCITECAPEDENENESDKAVSIEDCRAVAEEIHASNFVVCNLSTRQGVQEVFEEAARVAMYGKDYRPNSNLGATLATKPKSGTESSSCVLQ